MMKYEKNTGQKLNVLSRIALSAIDLTEAAYVAECVFLISIQLLSISLDVS